MKEIIEIGDKRLAVLIDKPATPGHGYALSLHGGGLSVKESDDYLRDCFTDRGFGVVSFDFSGWGESTGERGECSLSSRLQDALDVVKHYRLKLDFIVGTSMGGYLALKLLEKIDVPNLILFCPAAYATSAWSLPFGGGFTEDIRRQDSFLESDAETICRAYRGNVLYFIGDRDEIIPAPIDRIYRESFRQASSFRAVLLDDCPHPIHRWAPVNPEGLTTILEEVSRFVGLARMPDQTLRATVSPAEQARREQSAP